jgi:hypothetical protein
MPSAWLDAGASRPRLRRLGLSLRLGLDVGPHGVSPWPSAGLTASRPKPSAWPRRPVLLPRLGYACGWPRRSLKVLRTLLGKPSLAEMRWAAGAFKSRPQALGLRVWPSAPKRARAFKRCAEGAPNVKPKASGFSPLRSSLWLSPRSEHRRRRAFLTISIVLRFMFTIKLSAIIRNRY